LIQLKNKHMSEDEASAAAHGSLLYQYKNIWSLKNTGSGTKPTFKFYWIQLFT
jgi:hypothetical protein